MNDEIKEIIENENIIYFISDLINEKNDYKSRIEKAVEYVEEAKEQDFMWTPIFMKELLNILNVKGDE